MQKSCNQSYEKVAAETALNMPLSLAEIRLFFDFLNEQYSLCLSTKIEYKENKGKRNVYEYSVHYQQAINSNTAFLLIVNCKQVK